MMRYGILGTVEVRSSGRPVPIRRARTRAVLAYLLFDAGRLVSVGRLIEAIWGGAPPATARAQLHADISNVRRALQEGGATPLVTMPGGYMLEAGREEVDYAGFRDLVGRAKTARDPGEAATLLHTAIGLWRGPSLAGANAAFVDGVRSQLDDERYSAYESVAEIDLALGRHAEVADELSAAAPGAPLRERLHSQLMLALYRAGRPADALAVARKLRRRLAEEHGIDPGRDLVAMEHRILAGDPRLDWPARPWRAAGPPLAVANA
jgi:DNA-binding SARP family transcriptional activator